ncbi:hypothetical protein FSHL1_009619 [Fusarium sambucinum]
MFAARVACQSHDRVALDEWQFAVIVQARAYDVADLIPGAALELVSLAFFAFVPVEQLVMAFSNNDPYGTLRASATPSRLGPH